MPKPAQKVEFRTFGGPPSQMEIVGVKSDRVRDAYHFLLERPWWVTIAVIAGVFLAVNVLFAVLYWATGGIANARPGSLEDAFFFSVQTLGTIGYGAMYPRTSVANALVAVEALCSVIVMALSTGIAFAKFARSDARIVYTQEAVICPLNGVPHLMFRVANQRGNLVTSAHIRLALIREERSAEGARLYRLIDLHPVRDHHIAFSRTWTVMHPVDERSPLHGSTPESLTAEEAEIVVALEGLDATTGQTIMAQHSYIAREVIFGAQHAEIWTDLPDGRSRMDFRLFHTTEPTQPSAAFPYRGGERVTG